MNRQFIDSMVSNTQRPTKLQETKKIIEKWNKTGLLKKLDKRRAGIMAQLLETEALGLRELNESSSVSDIAGFNKIAFPLVRRVFAQLIANEIVSVQPMSLPSGLLFYLDFTFDRNKGGFTTGGSVYGSRTAVTNPSLEGIGAQNAAGGFYELNSGYTQRSFLLGTASATYSTVTTTSAKVAGTLSGFDFALSNSAVTDLAQLQNIRVALSGQMNFREGTFRGLSAIESLSAETLYSTIDPTLTQLNADGSVRIFSTTNFVAASSSAVGVMRYVPYGPVKTDLQDNPKSTVLGDFEAVTGIPEVNISISSVPVMAETRKLKTKWTPELAQDLNAYHALDAEIELTTILSELIALEIDREILGELLHGAVVRAAWSRKIGRYLSLSADNVTVSVNTFANASQTNQAFYGTQQEWYQTLGEVVNVVSNEIHKRSLRHGANFIVTSPEISAILESINTFKPSILSDANETEYSLGMEKTGTLNNRYTIYKDPYFPSDMMLLGYKGGSFLETGFVYAPYIPLLVTPTIFAPEDFTPRRGVMTRYAKQMVRPEFYGTVKVFDIDWIGNVSAA